MRIVIVWNEQTDYAREVREWLDAYKHDGGGKIEHLDPETKAGADFAEAYDIVEYPTILALQNDGKVSAMWRGTPLPQVEQVMYWGAE
jgi:hypothetical protein